MKLHHILLTGLIASCALTAPALADERHFTYVYEPETLPKGAFEFENWITLRSARNGAVGQEHYSRWDLRQELEYGITDRYTAALYLNEKNVHFRDPITGVRESDFGFEGLSLENRFQLFNPAEYKIGMTLYLEGRYSGDEAEVEQKLILGQRYGAWKWAFNLEHATEWEEDLSETEGEIGASLGVARDLGKHWSVGLELVNHNLLPEYRIWENSALFLGPTASYRREKWWTALTVLPQIYGWNSSNAPDGDSHLELKDHEKLQIRLLFGFNF
jgi:hypothetical protein